MEEEKLEFAELCKDIIRRVRQEGGSMSHRDLGRSFQGNVRFKKDLDSALLHLVDTEQLLMDKASTGGRPSITYRIPAEAA
jgi:hypothetical protein